MSNAFPFRINSIAMRNISFPLFCENFECWLLHLNITNSLVITNSRSSHRSILYLIVIALNTAIIIFVLFILFSNSLLGRMHRLIAWLSITNFLGSLSPTVSYPIGPVLFLIHLFSQCLYRPMHILHLVGFRIESDKAEASSPLSGRVTKVSSGLTQIRLCAALSITTQK